MQGNYPIKFDIEYPEKLSKGLIFIKWLLAIPHNVILSFYGIAVGITTFIAWWAILFTGKYPKSLFDFAVGFCRWQIRVQAYSALLLRDEYPPFGTE